ncbi:MAG: hypothetical protein WBO92_05195 [Candidatus Moraniibacteriota bacterium]
MRSKFLLGAIVWLSLIGGLSTETAVASTLSGGPLVMGTDNFRIDGVGNGLNIYTGNSNVYVGTIAVTGVMQIMGSVALPTDNFSIVGVGSVVNFYTGNSSDFAGALFVTGGTLSGSASCNTDQWYVSGAGTHLFISCDNGPGGSITFTDTPPICTDPPGGPYGDAWCQGLGYDYSTDSCLGYCACTAPNVWDGADCVVSAGPVPPVVDLKINGSNGPLALVSGAVRNFTWTAANATTCTASSGDGWSGVKAATGAESLVANLTTNHTLTCTGPGGTMSDSVQVTIMCTPSTGTYGVCNCMTERKSRTNTNAACLPWTETTACSAAEKDACRNINWREVEQ